MPSAPPTIGCVRVYKINTFPKTPDARSVHPRGSRQHLLIQLRCESVSGWGECMLSANEPDADILGTVNCLGLLRGMTASQAFAAVHSLYGMWRPQLIEATEFALLDLQGKLTGRSAANMLVLEGRMPVPLLFSIHTRDPDEARRRAILARSQKTAEYVKLRLFGDTDLDRALIAAVREELPSAFILGDAAESYGSPLTNTYEKIGIRLLMLYSAGLNACMDPAPLPLSEWRLLKEFADPLKLCAGTPLRRDPRTINTIDIRLADYFYFRPECFGSVYDAVFLADRLSTQGAHIIVGDNALIGPGCTEWQQLAIAFGACCAEASYKEGDSDFFLSALRSSGSVMINGYFHMIHNVRGFGLELDELALSNAASFTAEL